MKRFIVPVISVWMFYACHSNSPGTGTNEIKPVDTAVKKNYLPVADYLKSEIAGVDSFPFRIMRYHIVNSTYTEKMDSGIITTGVFDQLAREFLRSELDSAHFENSFEENSFVDRSTNLVSFTYSTKDSVYGLKRVDVLLSPGAGTDKLKSIYMEVSAGNKDTTQISKLYWKAGRNFKILHIQQPKSGKETSNQTIVVWDSRD